MKKILSFAAAAVAITLAMPAFAAVKVYNATPPNGTAGDQFQYSAEFCPPIEVTPGIVTGSYTISDTGGGTVTLDDFTHVPLTFVDSVPTS